MKKHLVLVPAALALTLSGCSGSADSSTATDTTPASSTPSAGATPGGGAPGGDGAGGMGFPGANGEVAAVQGDVLQVQSAMSGQVAVTLTKKTEITAQVATDLDAVEVGTCVVVMGGADDDSAATTVRISDPVDGECTGGTGGAGGFPGGGQGGDQGNRPEPPSGAPSDLPSDMPSDMPSGGPGGGRGNVVAGEVTAVDGSGFTVAAVAFDSGETTDTEVTVDADTTFTTTADASADDITVRRCVSARGEADDTGAVTAESVTVSDKVDGECSVGGFGGGFGDPGANAA
ncbi:hypothetical protein J2X46_001626 [Nocardioides sp. BE266]|uniref:hypothetical protein n=1 Tax=Nocardioides sp. BE266 TaxID=2817725 RepID=UPI00285B5322|nr:hypothetical protein [Nocardioides sp. BE266]MDR7252650.1 hypothetical protein [Nocardioides sp. BE266]